MVERVVPRVIRNAIEQIYRLPLQFGKGKYSQASGKIKRIVEKLTVGKSWRQKLSKDWRKKTRFIFLAGPIKRATKNI